MTIRNEDRELLDKMYELDYHETFKCLIDGNEFTIARYEEDVAKIGVVGLVIEKDESIIYFSLEAFSRLREETRLFALYTEVVSYELGIEDNECDNDDSVAIDGIVIATLDITNEDAIEMIEELADHMITMIEELYSDDEDKKIDYKNAIKAIKEETSDRIESLL